MDGHTAKHAELTEARMKAGRLQARCSVFMQAMGWLASNGVVDGPRQGEPVMLPDSYQVHHLVEVVTCAKCIGHRPHATDDKLVYCTWGHGIHRPDWYCPDGERALESP